MNEAEKETFEAIVKDFERYYRSQVDAGFEDNLIARTAFYQSCLDIAEFGPRMRSPAVQEELVKYYTELRDEKYAELVRDLPPCAPKDHS